MGKLNRFAEQSKPGKQMYTFPGRKKNPLHEYRKAQNQLHNYFRVLFIKNKFKKKTTLAYSMRR